MIRINQSCFIIVFAFLISACSTDSRPIKYGEDHCVFCKMTVVDAQHAAELVTSKGRIYTFDAIECLVNFILKNADMEFAKLLVNDYDSPEKLIRAQDASFLISKNIPSPMGAFLSAFEDESKAIQVRASQGGELYTWTELLTHFKNY